ncbi:MAG: 3-phosphoshikimate 1-carboxyvinyltransferase [Candidatus Acidiferrales bacterium]
MARKIIRPGGTVTGVASLPGDKSISHRYAILAALAEGRSSIANFSPAADCAATLECLARLGVKIERAKDGVHILGKGLDGLAAPRRSLNAKNSGTTMRLLAGVLAGQKFSSTLTGDSSLCRRPMRRVIEPLALMGAHITARESEFPPLTIRGAPLRAIDYAAPLPSAQVKSAILLAGLFADGCTSVTEPVATRDHTEIALLEFGASIRRTKKFVQVEGRPHLHPCSLTVPGDLSSTVFFLAAALILPGSDLVLEGVGLNPTRTAVLDFLVSIDAPIRIVSVAMRDGELVGNLAVRHAALRGGTISGPAVAAMIDELPMLAALAPYTEQGIEIRDARELRVKESDRIAALSSGLRAIGAQVEEFPDGLRVAGRSAGRLRGGAAIDSSGDHRIAMALAIAALGAEKETVIRGAECAAVSFPDFFPALERLISPVG